MKSVYQITGMTCNGCRSGVEQVLNNVSGVFGVHVDLEQNEAIIEAKDHINIAVLREALPQKYTITEKEEQDIATPISPVLTIEEKSELQQLFPLFLIFGYITIASVWLNYNPWDTGGFMYDFMGLFYIVFSFFKMLDLRGFPKSFSMYDPLAKMIPIYGWIYPCIETILGIMFLTRFHVDISLIATLLILGITTFGVIKVLLDKKSIQCACLGTALQLPMTKATLIENSVMLVMATWMLMN